MMSNRIKTDVACLKISGGEGEAWTKAFTMATPTTSLALFITLDPSLLF